MVAKRPDVLPINTADDLLLFAHAVNKPDNDLTSMEWTPIGNANIPFSGTFDGAGHTISGLLGVCTGAIDHNRHAPGAFPDDTVRNFELGAAARKEDML